MIDLEISKAIKGSRPNVILPDPAILAFLKEEGIRKLVSDHYDRIKVSSIRHLFPPDDVIFEAAKKHSADFFVQICGGPNHYNENRGAPMLVRRHMPFPITSEAREVWLAIYQELLPELGMPDELLASFWEYLNQFSIWMINTD
ncbi:MAG: globin [Bacteroidales bacterium]|nr:globin [Bacteroidales bacterium]